MSTRVGEARHYDQLLGLRRTNSFDKIFGHERQYRAPAEAASNWRAPIRSRNTSSTRRVKAENNTTKVTDPRAVTSTAMLVSHGVRIPATASRIARSWR